MKANSQEHVERCETATTPANQCRCRCGGACHGRRLVSSGASREAFETLPSSDPHHLQSASEQRATHQSSSRAARLRRRLEKLNRDRRTFIEDVRRRNPSHAAEMEARWFTVST